MTYDAREVQAAFHREHALGYPLLQDVEARHFSAYGVLNEHFPPGDPNYGVPHPGVLYLSPDGIVLDKFAYPGFRERPSFEAIHDAVAAD